MAENKKTETATFGNGCFWCTEAVFQQLKGVEKVTSGYSGGHVENPTYEQVCGKKTGHAGCDQNQQWPRAGAQRRMRKFHCRRLPIRS